uniref:BLOC-1-related complex subunit 7 n=1 Tax=Leptobrachium leishanense TaxID=445787 RepID=A0A8C5QZM2_9ANUR
MATSADGQARYGHSVRGLLTEKVGTCGADVIALTKQVLKGSRSSELLSQAARNMVMQEDSILHSEDVRRTSQLAHLPVTLSHPTWVSTSLGQLQRHSIHWP